MHEMILMEWRARTARPHLHELGPVPPARRRKAAGHALATAADLLRRPRQTRWFIAPEAD